MNTDSKFANIEHQGTAWVQRMAIGLCAGFVFTAPSISFAQQDSEPDSPYILSDVNAKNTESTINLTGDFQLSLFGEGENEAFSSKSELWADNWGVSAELKQGSETDILGLPKDSSYFNLDVKRRFGSRDKSNIELGLGWQELSIDSQLDASGPKVSLSGKYNLLKDFQVYGSTAYYPVLEDDIKTGIDLSAYEIEAGLLYKPLPSVSVKAGYRVFTIDLSDGPVIEDLGSTSGFYWVLT